jgi:hypothetical protein
LLRAVPADPFDGRPLRYVRRPGVVAVYSVGADGTDDGGKPEPGNTYGRHADLVFRLYDPGERGRVR